MPMLLKNLWQLDDPSQKHFCLTPLYAWDQKSSTVKKQHYVIAVFCAKVSPLQFYPMLLYM